LPGQSSRGRYWGQEKRITRYENSRNSVASKQAAIAQWEKLSVQFVEKSSFVVALADEIAATGIHPADSLHIACAITAHCDYIITVDKRMAKFKDNRIIVCSPVDFIGQEAENDE
jgi:predicted nucleic acid-binding protein